MTLSRPGFFILEFSIVVGTEVGSYLRGVPYQTCYVMASALSCASIAERTRVFGTA